MKRKEGLGFSLRMASWRLFARQTRDRARKIADHHLVPSDIQSIAISMTVMSDHMLTAIGSHEEEEIPNEDRHEGV